MTKFVGQTVSGCAVISVNRVHRTTSGHYKYFYNLHCNTCNTDFAMAYEYAKRSKAPCPTCRKANNKVQADKGYKHPLHSTWWGMLMRCLDDTAKAYKNYGGRGITVCDRWRGARANNERFGSKDGFHAFCADMGDKPSLRHSVGRVDNDAGYSPENCAWQTPEEQMNNTRANVWVMVNGEQRTLSQWAKHLGVNAGRLAAASRRIGPEGAIVFLQNVPEDCRLARWNWKTNTPYKTQDVRKAELLERQKRWRELLAEKFGW